MSQKKTKKRARSTQTRTEQEQELKVISLFYGGTPEEKVWARHEIRKMGGHVWKVDVFEDEQGRKVAYKRPAAKVLDISKKRER